MNIVDKYIEDKISGAMRDYIYRNSYRELDLIKSIVETGEVPDKYDLSSINRVGDRALDNFYIRDIYNHHVSWCLVNNLWISDLYDYIKGSKVIELYAGKGLISKLLQDKGLDITAYDSYKWDISTKYTEVLNFDCVNAILQYPDNTLDYTLISWIPYEDTSCIDMVETLKKHQPNCKIIYIGEDYGGCTACDEFFDQVIDFDYNNEEEYELFKKLNRNFQQFDGIHDIICIYSI